MSAKLPAKSETHKQGWFDHVAIVHPVDSETHDLMLGHGYGNPFIHHLTWGIVPPDRRDEDDLSYASRVIPFMSDVRKRIYQMIGEQPGTLICALPPAVVALPEFDSRSRHWFAGRRAGEVQVESMQGGGFLLQIFVLTGGRIEVALRDGTSQTLNPKSVDKISRDEISTNQGAS